MSDLEEGNFQLDYLLQFKDDFNPDRFPGDIPTFKDPNDRISVRPWHAVMDDDDWIRRHE